VGPASAGHALAGLATLIEEDRRRASRNYPVILSRRSLGSEARHGEARRRTSECACLGDDRLAGGSRSSPGSSHPEVLRRATLRLASLDSAPLAQAERSTVNEQPRTAIREPPRSANLFEVEIGGLLQPFPCTTAGQTRIITLMEPPPVNSKRRANRRIASVQKSDMEFTCPWCEKKIPVRPGGWAFMRSQTIVHLHDCSRKPPELAAAALNLLCDKITETLEPR
jgi:hypothetical protein